MAQAEKIGQVKGLGTILRSCAPFDEQIKTLKEAGAKFPYLMSVRDMAYMRLHNGSLDSARTCLAPIYAKNSPTIIAMISPLIRNLEMASQAVEANRNENYFTTKDTEVYNEYVKIAEKDKSKNPEERKAILLPKGERGNYLIKPDSEEAKAIFGDVKDDKGDSYFKRFAEKGVTFPPIDKEVIDKQKGTTIGYLWFWHPVNDSDLDGSNRNLYDDLRAFGVLNEPGKDQVRDKKLARVPYVKSDIRRAQRELARLKKILNPNQIKDLESLVRKL